MDCFFAQAMATLDVFRTTVGAAALGFARRALDEATARALTRRLGAGTLADNAIIQSKLAEMVLDVDASALLVYRAAWLRDVKGQRNSREAALAKLHATDSAQQVIDKAVQIFGGLGVTGRRAGREPLSRDPGAAHLRGRVGGAEGGDRARPSRGASRHEDPAPARLAAAERLCQRHLRAAAG